ncbi:hypothetical protein [Brevundimonas sp.]|uniref:hypothetical protein n=1 Tax=Brevundimonas sp. TaxID=1871086 RepID=UPI00289CFAD4|nr:hypothetical protein [Brevundimonas sp.]
MGRSVSDQAKMLASAAGKAGARKAVQPVETVVVNGQTLDRRQVLDLQRAAALASGSVEQRRQAAALVRGVERQLASTADAIAVQTGVAETVQVLADQQVAVVVEDVETASFVRDAHGAVVRHQGEPVLKVETSRRARRVDGLASLLQSGSLTPADYETGMLYRRMVERAQAPVGSSLGERSGAVSVSSDKAVWAAIERGLCAVRLRMVKHAVGDARAMAVLDAVAGRGVTVRSLGGGGRGAMLDAERLVSALRTAGPLLRVSDEQLKKVLANRER